MEFWSDVVIDKSWDTLIKLTKEYNVLVIGGWAAYLLTKTIKSKDIDVVIDFKTLEKMRMNFDLKKNIHLKKYEIITDEISVDIYVPFFSKLAIPIEDLKKFTMKVEGINIVQPETLLILKQQAELERRNSVKGQKDRTDILNILINSSVDFKKYLSLIKTYKLSEYPQQLLRIVRTAKKEFEYSGIKDPRKIKLIKKSLIEKLRF